MPLLCATLLALALSSPLAATTLVRFDLKDLETRAERVLLATCLRAEPELLDGQIYTRVHFSVEETLKGTRSPTATLLLPGGQFQGVHSQIAGMPTFAPGERTVLFLTEENALGTAWPVGLAQGSFRIREGGAPKKARVYQQLDGLSFRTHSSAAKTTPVPPVQGMPLDEFLQQVRALSEKGDADAR